jgi:hypothetical protein
MQNLNGVDRVIRLVLGLCILCAAAIVWSGALLWIGVLVGLVLTISGAAGFCPAYGIMGFSTKEKEEAEATIR